MAPLEPARSACRRWLLGLAFSLAFLALAFRFGVGSPGGTANEMSNLTLSAAAAVATTALLPFPYAARAALVAALGTALMALGWMGQGPLAGLAADGSSLRDVARLAAMSLLPPALRLRFTYSAYRPTWLLLLLGWLAAVPAAVLEASLALDGTAPPVLRFAAAVETVIVLLSASALAPQDSTRAAPVWAASCMVAISATMGLREWTPLVGPDTGLLVYPATAVGMLCASLLVALGLYQLGCAGLAPHARTATEKTLAKVDLKGGSS